MIKVSHENSAQVLAQFSTHDPKKFTTDALEILFT